MIAFHFQRRRPKHIDIGIECEASDSGEATSTTLLVHEAVINNIWIFLFILLAQIAMELVL
jgi:hypothetical protein